MIYKGTYLRVIDNSGATLANVLVFLDRIVQNMLKLDLRLLLQLKTIQDLIIV